MANSDWTNGVYNYWTCEHPDGESGGGDLYEECSQLIQEDGACKTPVETAGSVYQCDYNSLGFILLRNTNATQFLWTCYGDL